MCMVTKDLKQAVSELAKRVGKPEARKQLVSAGISLSTAEKLIRETYPSEIGSLLANAISRAIEASKQRAS